MDLNVCTLVGLRYHTFSTHPPYPYKLFPWAEQQERGGWYGKGWHGKGGRDSSKGWHNNGKGWHGEGQQNNGTRWHCVGWHDKRRHDRILFKLRAFIDVTLLIVLPSVLLSCRFFIPSQHSDSVFQTSPNELNNLEKLFDVACVCNDSHCGSVS